MGLIMRDSVPYAGSNDIVLTQAQYDALVQAGEVLPNVNYYISNANHSTPIYASGVHYDNSGSGLDADDVQEAIDELDSLSTYSSSEVVVGKWIDNKPIYRKVLTGTISSNALVVGIGCDVDNVINLRCYLKKTNNLIFPIPYRNEVSANEYYQAYVFVNDTTNNNEVAVLCSSSNADYFNGSSVIAIVEYTKV